MPAKRLEKTAIAQPTPSQALEELRGQAFRSVKLEDIHRMEKSDLLSLQSRLGLGDEWGIIEFPKSWMPPGGCSQLSYRRIDVEILLGKFASSAVELESAICAVVRMTILCILSPVYTMRFATYLAPSSVAQTSKRHIKLAMVALRRPVITEGRIFERISLSEFAGTSQEKKRLRIELERMSRFAERGLWTDIATDDQSAAQDWSPVGPKRRETAPPQPKPYTPFPDRFTAAAGWRVAWMIEVFGPALIECGRGLQKICKEHPLEGASKGKNQGLRTEFSKEFLKNFSWKTPEGHPIDAMPFEMDFSGMGRGGKFKWPVRTLAQARMLLRMLQSAHLFVFLISTGGRISEALSLHPGCIVESSEGVPLANGRTYKLTYRVGGKERDWPLPKLGVDALRQQEELAKLILDVDPDGDNEAQINKLESIWTREGGDGERIDGEYNKYLRNIVKIFALSEEFGNGQLHAHRFRKTIARLIALAVVGAPKILMDLFGHRQIEMTLHYILSDPTIRAEMTEVARAQTIMLAQDAILDASNCGGPAAATLKAAVATERHRMGSDFGEASVQDLAEMLTLNGQHWQLVRPGVICTKGPQVAGACTPNTAMPEPSRCRTKCGFRLEMAFLEDDVDQIIGNSVQYLEEALKNDDETAAEMWTGQILSNITRFDRVKKRWSAHPIVKNVLENAQRSITP